MHATRVTVLALALTSFSPDATLAAPGPLGPEFPAEDRPLPEDGWWSTCTDARGIRSTIVPDCIGDDCPDAGDLYIDRRGANGDPLGEPLKLNDDAAQRVLFRLSCHPSGWVVAQWREVETDCYVHRLVAPNGEPVAPALRTVVPGNDCRARASIGVRSDGTFLATCGAAYLTGGSGVVVQAYGADAEPAGDPVTVTDSGVGWNRLPKIAVADDDTVLVAWSGDSGDGGTQPVLARCLDTGAKPLGEVMQLDSFAYGENAPPAVASDGSGTFVVTWSNPILGGRVARRVAIAGAASNAIADVVGHVPQDLPRFGAARVVDSREVETLTFDARVRTLDTLGASGWIVGRTDGSVQVSDDDGKAWSEPMPLDSAGNVLAVAGSREGTAIALVREYADRLDALRSTDRGSTWIDQRTVTAR